MVNKIYFLKLYIFSLIVITITFLITISAYAKDEDWKFIINTPDGTPETGSTENTVGFDDCGLYSKIYSTKSKLDKDLDTYNDHTEYWRYDGSMIGYLLITENGSLQVMSKRDLYFYDGVAYNGKTGAAYSDGHYFTVSWKLNNDVDLSGVSEMNPLSYVDSFSFTSNDSLRGTTSSFYNLMVTFAGAGMVFSLIFAGIKLAFHGVKALKDDLLNVLGYKILAFMILCTFVGVFGLFGELIETLVKL